MGRLVTSRALDLFCSKKVGKLEVDIMGYVSLGPVVPLEAECVLERNPHLEGEMVRSGHVPVDIPESRHLRLEGPVDPVVGVTRVAFGIRSRPVLEVEGRRRGVLWVWPCVRLCCD